MDSLDSLVKEAIRKLQIARLSLMNKQPFYAVLLLHMDFSIDPACDTAYTDGKSVSFGPKYLLDLESSELEFVLMHEVLHAALNHCNRKLRDYNDEYYNIAADIIVNSNILYSAGNDISSIMLKDYGVCMHTAPNGIEGYNYNVEELYEMVKTALQEDDVEWLKQNDADTNNSQVVFDDHSRWEKELNDSSNDKYLDDDMEEIWLQRMMDATQIATQIKQDTNLCGRIPMSVERQLKEVIHPTIDWRTILNCFIQEEICDYSFNPPDRRFQDFEFILPDYNETNETVKNILFMVDTSASMTNEQVSRAYSEIKGAIDQFNGALAGWLGFFDATVIEPKAFTNEDEFRVIRAIGNGGTDYKAIFKYIQRYMVDIDITSIVILTDGYADFPDEEMAMGIPVLWIINNDEITPPWGKVARIVEGVNNEKRF